MKDEQEDVATGLLAKPLNQPGVEKVLNTLSCLNTLDDVIDTVDAAAQLVEDNGPELVYLTAIFEKLQGERDIVVTIRSSAKILRVLQVLRKRFAAGG